MPTALGKVSSVGNVGHAAPHIIHHRIGGWLPKDHRVLHAWLTRTLAAAKSRNRDPSEWDPVVKDFRALIEGNPDIYMNFHLMFDEVPDKDPYKSDPTGTKQIKDYMTMLDALDYILTQAPDYEQNDLVGFPINAILDWPMGTTAGLDAFMNPKVNTQFFNYFVTWAKYLTSPASTSVLNTSDSGWFGPAASVAMPNFTETYVCDPLLPAYGYQSWDDFFVRLFQPDVRPVDSPLDNTIVNSACESSIYKIARGINALDNFWIKGEPYSLNHMLNNDELTSYFVGGTIYQAFLSATKYHRWHSPVNGTIRKVVNIPGTYYAESPVMGFISADPSSDTGQSANPDGPDPAAPNLSQAFITTMAARALVFIDAENADIGLMCFIAVGMAEVSTCEVTVVDNQTVKKGDQLGMFHFGGSTHCLLFRPSTNIVFTQTNFNTDVKLNTAIGQVLASPA